jgi:voltage-gated potassium channel
MTRVEHWERRSEIPLVLLALAFLVAYAWPVIDPQLDADTVTVLTFISWTVWAAFAIDFSIRIAVADARLSYVRRHWYDVALIALPMLRPLRLLRLLALARILDRSASGSLAGTAVVYAAGTAVMAVGLGSLAVLDAERGEPKANITNFADALWWAGSTVTTAGPGEFYPVTGAGRIVALVLMLVGVGLVGVVIAAVAAWFVGRAESKRPDPTR